MTIKKFKKSKVLDNNSNIILKTEIEFNTKTKTIINFSIILVLFEKNYYYEIIKYDASHKYCHVHKFYENINDQGKPILPSQISPKAISYFKNDVLKNWKDYSEKYKRKWLK